MKVISYDTIRGHNYGENILREISCLRRLSHPSIARLISSFRWRDGIYLVLEYGACGDLHSYIRRNGPLGEKEAKLVIGEVGTALTAVHEAGFVYGDLKPENVVITATKHVKLADFGACRPSTAQAKQMLVDARDELTNMRSGDWKCENNENIVIELSVENILNPKTFEGTSAYLSPEILASPGIGPSVLSDAYALGMTSYFLLRGRLPQWAAADDESKLFDSSALMRSDPLLESDLTEDGKKFILSLTEADPNRRISVLEALSADWLADVQPVRRLFLRTFTDHLSGAEDGAAMTAAESAWEKRQLSKIWTAQPTDYAVGARNIASNEAGLTAIEETDIERGSPFI